MKLQITEQSGSLWLNLRHVCLILMGLLLFACGSSQADHNTQATQVAANIFATMTATAPTSTPASTPTSTRVPTPSNTPTNTPLPSPTLTPKPTLTPSPTPVAIPILAKGWSKLEIRTLCLKVEQSYPKLEQKANEPIHEVSRDLLSNMGIRVVPFGTTCDAELTIVLVGNARSSSYSKPGETIKRTCFNGAAYDGTMSLSAKGIETLTIEVGGAYWPSLIGTCIEKPSLNAEYDPAWQEALINGFNKLWGTPAMVSALQQDSSYLQKAALEALDALAYRHELGPEVVPYLVELLDTGRLTQEVTTILAYMEKKAWQAIPALIRNMEALKKDDVLGQWSLYNYALLRITGATNQPSSKSCFDSKCMSAWWKEWWGNGRPAP